MWFPRWPSLLKLLWEIAEKSVSAAPIQVMENIRLIDTPSTYELEVAHLRGIDPGLPDFAWSVISKFRPRLETPAQWTAIRPFAISTVLRQKPREFDASRRLMTIVTRYTAWVWATTGAELTPERVFKAALVTRFVEQRLANHSPAYRFDVTRHLCSTMESLTGVRGRRLPMPPASRNMVPYSAKAMGQFHSWALSRNSDRRRHNAYSILALCGGAGLTAAELVGARIEDISTQGHRVFVQVNGTRARRVPILDTWYRVLDRAIDGRTDGDLFHGNRSEEYPPRLVQSFLSEQSFDLRVSPSRLRLTWVVRQLEHNLPLPVLLDIAGFSNASAVNAYLRHLTPQVTADFLDTIAGAEANR